jgi:hypothetical protein
MAFSLQKSTDLRRWLIAFVLFSAFGGIWGLSSPLFNVPDEPEHAVYAAAAVRGQVWATTEGGRTTVTVPADFAAASGIPTCFEFQPHVPAGCAPQFGGRSGDAEATTTVGHYPPAYYAYAGLATLVADGKTAVYLMRALTVVLVAGLLASAACSALATQRPPLALAGLGLATTPMLFFFAGSVNPQAPEIAAAISLWCAGLVLLTRLRVDPDLPLTWRNPLLRRCLMAVLLLTVTRPLSLLWLTLIVVALLALSGTSKSLVRLMRTGAVIGIAPLVFVTAGSTLAWVVFRDSLTLLPVPQWAETPFREAVPTALSTIDAQLVQMVGTFGWLDTPLRGWVVDVFLIGLVGVGTLSLAVARRREMIVLGLIAAAVLLIPTVLQLMTYRESGFTWQGRYTLPLAVGVPLVLGLLLATHEDRRPAGLQGVVRVSGIVFVVVQVAALLWALNRNVNGINGFLGVTPAGWAPPLPVGVLAVALASTAVAAVILALRAQPPVVAVAPIHPASAPVEAAATGRPASSDRGSVDALRGPAT